jgi:hypothetical protein
MNKFLTNYIVILLLPLCLVQYGCTNLKSPTSVAVKEDSKKFDDIFKDTFNCAGMYLIDPGMALHRDNGNFIEVGTYKPICTYRGALAPICEDTSKNQTCTCPPPEWNANKCSEKYDEFQHAKNLEWKKSQDKTNIKQE